MQKNALRLLSVLLILAAVIAADDPRKKPWTQWSQGDAEEVVRDTNVSATLRLTTSNPDAAAEAAGEPRIQVVAQWSTAAVRRRANLRVKVLAKEITEEQAQQGAAQTPQHILIQLALLSNDRMHFNDLAGLEKAALAKAEFRFSQSKILLRPEKVECVARPDVTRPALVRLYFTRAAASAVSPGEKKARLVWKGLVGGFQDLDVEFDLRRIGANPATDY